MIFSQGRVATYGQIAALAGKPHGSRGVAWILHTCSTRYQLPWQRVINSQGKISFDKATHNFRRQRLLLSKEAVEVSINGTIDLHKFQWKKTLTKIKKNRAKGPRMFAD